MSDYETLMVVFTVIGLLIALYSCFKNSNYDGYLTINLMSIVHYQCLLLVIEYAIMCWLSRLLEM